MLAMLKNGFTKTCERCGGSFYVKRCHSDARFCSIKCRRTGSDLNCERCGKVFYAPRWRERQNLTIRFCSVECRNADAMSPEELLEAKRRWGREDHQRHKKERLQKAAQKYQENREAIRAKRKKWAKENAGKVTEQSLKRRQRHGDKIRAKRRQHYRDNKASYVANARSREKHIKQATPPWADLKAIEAFYAEAARLTLETGVVHHVDHKYPLRSRIMCGLHVETNLQVLPAAVNLKKSNRVLEGGFDAVAQ